jgi:hypothetical protein
MQNSLVIGPYLCTARAAFRHGRRPGEDARARDFGKIPARPRGIISAGGGAYFRAASRDILTGMDVASFSELKTVHHWLDELFLQHQVALLSGNLDAAERRFGAYTDALDWHMSDEDTHLIPLFDARAGHVPGGHRDFFIGEHTKLTALVSDCRARLAALRTLDGEARQRATVALFDREAFLKTYVEHHHAREENILFPTLDQVTTPDERVTTLARCRSVDACREAGALAR